MVASKKKYKKRKIKKYTTIKGESTKKPISYPDIIMHQCYVCLFSIVYYQVYCE